MQIHLPRLRTGDQADASGLNELRRNSILEIGVVMRAFAWLIMLNAIGFPGRIKALLVTLLLLGGAGGIFWLRRRHLHLAFRMLYSRGISLHALGIPGVTPPSLDKKGRQGDEEESTHRQIWQTFADHFYLFRAAPTGIWITDELETIFGIDERLNGDSARRIYDRIAEKLAMPEFRPRALYEKFNIKSCAPPTRRLTRSPTINKFALRAGAATFARPFAPTMS